MKISSTIIILGKLRKLLTKRHKVLFLILLGLAIVVSLIETIGISSIMPFITVASNPAALDEGKLKQVFDFLRFTEKSSFIIIFGFSIIIFYFFRSIINVLFTNIINKYSCGTSRYFSLKLFKIYCSIPYKHFVTKNTGDILQVISGETGRTSILIQNILMALSELFTMIMLYCLIIVVNWQMSLVLTAILAVIIFLVIEFLFKISKLQGIKTSEAGQQKNRTLFEAFGNYKFIKFRGNENDFLNRYGEAAKVSDRANIITATLGVLPRNILESIGFSLLIGVVIYITWKIGSPETVIPVISMYALALYRMLPATTRILSNLNTIAFNHNALDVVYNAVSQETENEGNAPLSFEKSIKIESVSFKYVTGREVLTNAGLKINKGENVAITGASGAGKSTLVDILTGIHKPNSGILYVDDIKITNDNIRSWRSKIGYIPQSIYLFDGTVAENVAFASEINQDRLVETLKMANIWDFLKNNNGIHTRVGEGGIQLSGGQKQRVGIARALYNNPEVLVLDEATSSLDNETEGKIMDEIYAISENKTLIVIAHRLTTVERCKKRIIIEDGRLLEDKNAASK